MYRQDNKKRALLAWATLLCALFTTGAWATPINFLVTGTVIDGSGDFGLDTGDSIYISGVFDDEYLTGIGPELVEFGAGSGNLLELLIGDVSFSELSEVSFDFGYPVLEFFDGIFDGLDFIGLGEAGQEIVYFTVAGMEFFETPGPLYGLLDDGSFQFNPPAAVGVPEPGTVALLGLGMLALMLFRRRAA